MERALGFSLKYDVTVAYGGSIGDEEKADVIDEANVISSECKYIQEVIREGMGQTQIRKVKNYRN